jgi:hypothetical protein
MKTLNICLFVCLILVAGAGNTQVNKFPLPDPDNQINYSNSETFIFSTSLPLQGSKTDIRSLKTIPGCAYFFKTRVPDSISTSPNSLVKNTGLLAPHSESGASVKINSRAEKLLSPDSDHSPLTTQLVVYPNPVQNQLFVNVADPSEYDHLYIYDMRGTVMQQQPVSAAKMKLDISLLQDGVYLLMLRSAVTLKERMIKFVVRK